jgi:HD-GYP domain-containing protein (c-di-GMP phosphodiesterase class II)
MSSQAVGPGAPDGLRLRRYLPLSVAVTLAVTLLPLFAVSQLGPAHTPLALALHVLAAVVLSILIARVLAALWTRNEHSSDLVFGDLLLWGWGRRALAERRLDTTSQRLLGDQPGDARVPLLQRMSRLLEKRDAYTHGHSRRVARHAERTARAMGLSRERIELIRAAALVHDIGKINVPRSILTKRGKLTEEEFALVKRHAADGAAMVAPLGDAQLTAIVRHHHERIDGSGYPDGLAGADIPVGARVIAVADTFDAITSTRSYRKPRTHRQALDVLQEEAGTQLDPEAVAAFVSYYTAGRSVGLATAVTTAPQRIVTGLGGLQGGLAASVAPLAQTACGVGGVALIGACLGGPVLPSHSTQADAGATTHSQSASRADRAPQRVAAAPRADDRAGRRAHEPTTRPVAEVNDPGVPQTPADRVAPRSLEVPDQGSPGSAQPNPGSGGTGGGGSGGGGQVTVPDAPSVVDTVETVLQPVTDNVPVPKVETPVPLPQVGLP